MKTDKFFASTRKNLFNNSLKQSQVDGSSAIIIAIDYSGIDDAGFTAYILATVYCGTARTMQLNKEFGKG